MKQKSYTFFWIIKRKLIVEKPAVQRRRKPRKKKISIVAGAQLLVDVETILQFSEAGRHDQSPQGKWRLCTTAPLFLPRAVVTLSIKRAKLETQVVYVFFESYTKY